MLHSYRRGDLVVPSLTVPPGHYKVIRLLPCVWNEPHCQGRSAEDGHHGKLTEGQLLKAAAASEAKSSRRWIGGRKCAVSLWQW